MPNITPVSNITPPRVALIDPRTGLISREWYRFFLNLFQLTGGGTNSTSLTDLQQGPPSLTVDTLEAFRVDPSALDSNPTGASLVSEIAEIEKQVAALEAAPASALQEVVAESQKQIQALQVTPASALQESIDGLQKQLQALQVMPPPRDFKRARYGSFYDTTTQTATTINTAKAITFNSTDLSQGVYVGATTSRVYVDTEGVYNFALSIQLDKTSGGTALFHLWFRKNGVDVANSASQIRIQGNDNEIFSALNYFFDLAADDYVELMFSVSDLSVEIKAFAAAAPVPATPSIILTVSNNIKGVQ